MLAEYLAQAEALGMVFRSGESSILPSEEALSAAILCADKLYLWGDSLGVLRFVQSMETTLTKLPAPWVLRIEFHRLRALSTLRRDQECLERTRALLDAHEAARSAAAPEV